MPGSPASNSKNSSLCVIGNQRLLVPTKRQHEPAYGDLKLAIASRLERLDLGRALAGEIRPNSPSAFALLKPDNGPRSTVSPAAKMQDKVFACPFCVREVIKIYDAAIRRADKIHG
jgi:hypothetical protein